MADDDAQIMGVEPGALAVGLQVQGEGNPFKSPEGDSRHSVTN